KARVATEVAARLVADRVARTSRRAVLRELDDRAAVERAIEGALRETPRPACLILEGCEGGREAVVGWIEAHLDRDPQLVVLATSRARLGLPAEHVVAVEPLDEDDAVALFESLVAAARGGRGSFDPAAAAEARTWVRRVGGLPLVLELAAAQTHVLAMRDLLARETTLLDLLASPHPRPRPHEATLRAAIDGAWRRLDARARHVLAICARFEGPFELRDVEAIAGEARPPIARHLARLADVSLVAVARPGREPWLVLHPPVRAIAREASRSDGDALRRAWAEHVLRAVREVAEGTHVAHASSSIARFREDLVAIAADPALLGLDPDEIATRALALLARSRGPVDQALAALDRSCVRASDAEPSLRARLHHLRGVLFGRAGSATRAHADLDLAASLAESAGDTGLAARIATDHGDLLRHGDEHGRARAAYERAVELARNRSADAGGDGGSLVLALVGLASMAHERGDLEDAVRRHAELDAIVRASGARSVDDAVVAVVYQSRGTLLVETGDHEGAERAFRDALAAHRTSGNRRFEGIAEHDLGCLALEHREVAKARAHFERAERWAREVGDRRELGLCHALLGVCEALVGEQSLAETWLASAEMQVHRTGEPALVAAFEAHRAHLVALDLRRRRQRGETLPEVLLDELHGALARADAHASEGDEVRLARRVLAAEASRVLRTDRIVVSADGTWFFAPRVGRVSLARKGIFSRLLAALVGARIERPDGALSAESLARAGWPATRALTPTAKNRLHVAITSMRKLGLGESLAYGPDGYRLVDVDVGERR
ncbi:MAG: hypothetical protein IT379_01240, partial [Deltaproteobacteria bacterium]|nr:hypothetical protein [Deltaproteobacteria bacterium]